MIGCLMIHGYTGSPDEVAPLADYLRKHTDWMLDVPALPGHGQELALEHVTHRDWLATAEEALERLKEKADTIYLIGFSMGGMIAAYLASKHTIAKLVLLAPSGKYLAVRRILRDLLKMTADGVTGSIDHNELYLYSKYKWCRAPLKANIEFLKLVRLTRASLSRVTAPVLIVHGLKDIVVPYQTGCYMDQKIASAQRELVLFEQSGHMLCLGSDSAVLNRMVHRFLLT